MTEADRLDPSDGSAPPFRRHPTRRELLLRSGLGLGALGLTALLRNTAVGGSVVGEALDNPLLPRAPHFPARARHVIHLFANGGPSHVDTFDPKPALAQYVGKSLPIASLPTERKTGTTFPSPFSFRRCGQSGIEISEIFPNLARCADHLCVVRSMKAEVPNHEPSLMLMNCGDSVRSRPSLGSWLSYGLGTENQNLPAFVAMCPAGLPIKGKENWQSGFLPGTLQGTYIDPRHESVEQLIANIHSRATSPSRQRQQLDLLRALDQQYRSQRAADPNLESRIQSFELAYRMQSEASDAFDFSREPQSVRERYGDTVQARQILLARRLVERGVRFVQLWHGAGQPWDNHDDLESNHRRLAAETDQALAALIEDLDQRGLLDSTLILWGGEFGRTPTVELKASGEPSTGRDHNPYGFTVWMAGGGVKGGHIHGATDELGFSAVEDVVHVHDLHATVLHLMGLDHERLTYRYAGRDFRLTDVAGRVVHELLA